MLIEQPYINKQAGAMLIMLAIFIVLASLTLLVTQLNGRAQKAQQNQNTAAALAEAKAALIGYAMTYDDTHPGEVYGYLPCPDTDATNDPSGEGAQSVCGNQNVSILGRLPWKTLKLSPLRDGAGECLWYAVSGNFKNNPKVNNLSPNFNGQFNVLAANGANIAGPAANSRAVAVIFAPGAILPGQDRSSDPNAVRCGGNYGAGNYLDADIFTNQNNALVPSVNSAYVAAEHSQRTANTNDQFNDQLLLIRRSEIFAAYCKKYVNTLLNQIAPTVNGCNASAAEVTPKVPKIECTKATDYLESTCTNTCYEAAEMLMTSDCLGNMAATSCQAALSTLKGCNV